MDRLSTSKKIYIKIEHNMTCWCWEHIECWCPECTQCNPCAEKKECCVPNIVADWDCINVETDSDWVIHLSTRCNPIIKSTDGSVNVSLDESWDVDVWDLEVIDNDHLVGACWNDKHPSTLDEKLEWVDWITVTPVCSDNWKVQIGIDTSQIHFDNDMVSVERGCSPRYLNEAIVVNSKYIRKDVKNCQIVLSDNESPALYYAKLVLAYDHIREVWWGLVWAWEEWLWQKAPVEWFPVADASRHTVPVSMLSWLKFKDWTPSNPWLWQIEITKKWVYQVWFTWSAEFSYWIHAFRVQLYKVPNATSKRHTIIESRYSGPLWYQPWQEIAWGIWNIDATYVSNVNLRDGGTVSSVNKNTLSKKIDFPLLSDKTEAEWLYQEQVYSQSLWAVMDRVTVSWNTIVELDVWDLLYVWLKVSTSIDHTGWDILWKVWDKFKTWHFALLGIVTEDSDNGNEAWFNFYANLIHSL